MRCPGILIQELPWSPCQGHAMLPRYGAFSVLLRTAKQHNTNSSV